MTLIELFESKPVQDVSTFNSIFKTTPILGYNEKLLVEILEPAYEDSRFIQVGEERIVHSILQKKSLVKKRTYAASTNGRKSCTKCTTEKCLIDFPACASNKDGRGSICTLCSNLKSKLYRANNREKVYASNKRWRENKLDAAKRLT